MESVCHLCGRAEEDTHHALWGCEALKQGWDRDFHWVNQFEASQGSFKDLVALIMTKPRVREVFATMAWFIWSYRKKSRLQEKSVPLSSIREAVCNFLQLFSSCREHFDNNSKMVRQCKWQTPNPGEYKTNFDGAMFNKCDEAGVGIVVQDSNGLVVAVMAKEKKKPHLVECLELLVARRAVIFTKEIGLQQSHFEGDSEMVIKGLQGVGTQFSSLGHLVRDTLSHVSSLWSFSFAHVVRQSNVVAHTLSPKSKVIFFFFCLDRVCSV